MSKKARRLENYRPSPRDVYSDKVKIEREIKMMTDNPYLDLVMAAARTETQLLLTFGKRFGGKG